MIRVYLCSRVAFDAHKHNVRAARALQAAGYSVFVPHLAPHNQAANPDSTDEDVYRLDMAEMMMADACVVVGRIGVDCAFEVGWFQAMGVPTVWYVPTGVDVGRNPMLHLVDRVRSTMSLVKLLKKLVPLKEGSAA